MHFEFFRNKQKNDVEQKQKLEEKFELYLTQFCLLHLLPQFCRLSITVTHSLNICFDF